MQLTTHEESKAAHLVAGLPRIDRFFPQCRFAALEAVAKLRFGIGGFDKVYGRHTFEYQRPAQPISFSSNGVELCLSFYRVEVPDLALEQVIEEVYGIQTRLCTFDAFDRYWAFCSQQLAMATPVTTDFDLFFIKGRREYGVLSSSHVINLYGYRPEAREVLASEQMLGEIVIDAEDFRRCFDHKVSTEGPVRVWELHRTRDGERDLSQEQAVAQVRDNLENLRSPGRSAGIAALRAFRDDMAEFVDNAGAAQPFSVPGIWVFSHERHMERKWLRSIAPLLGSTGRDTLMEFDKVLESLFKRWLSVDYLIEKSLASRDGGALKALPRYLDELIPTETRAMELWEGLLALASRPGGELSARVSP